MLFLKLVLFNSSTHGSYAQGQHSSDKIKAPAQHQASLCKIKAPRARSRLPVQDLLAQRSRLPVQDQGSLRKDHDSPRRIKAQGYLHPIFPVLFIPARAGTTSRPSKYGLKVHHAPHLERHPIDGECSSPSPSPSLLAVVPVFYIARSLAVAWSLDACLFAYERAQARTSKVSKPRCIVFPAKPLKPTRQADVSGLQAASDVRAHAAPKTTNFTARTSPLLLLRRALTTSLRSPPRCIALLACNGLSVERIVRTNDEKDAAWWATARATGTSGASPRARVGNGQRAHGLAPGRRGRGSG
ncbi:hypothetical protein DFH09DRAFT_1416387 [Mycena vulgaris]|nr:hypothetical protein DFH09DRAFT_1416387 [Mycena vulgaris]